MFVEIDRIISQSVKPNLSNLINIEQNGQNTILQNNDNIETNQNELQTQTKNDSKLNS
jgi:hypothetical protein